MIASFPLFLCSFAAVVAAQNDLTNSFTLYDLLVEEEDLARFTGMVVVAGNVARDYDNLQYNFTVFAPNDEALADLDSKYLTENYRSHTQYILDLHNEGGTFFSAADISALNGSVVETNSDENDHITIEVQADGTIELVTQNSRAKVVQADVKADNGYVHKIDSLLMPHRLTQDIVSVAQGLPAFDIVTKYLQREGIAEALSRDGLTFFAPTDLAFERLDNDTFQMLEINFEASKKLLMYHVVEGVYPKRMLREGLNATTLSGDVLFASNSSTGPLDATIDGVRLAVWDQVSRNGIAHVIETVLLPPYDLVDPNDVVVIGDPEEDETPTSATIRCFFHGSALLSSLVVALVTTAVQLTGL